MGNKTKGKELGRLIAEGIAQGLLYGEYRALIDQLVLQGKTTGLEQSQMYVGYTKLNQQRMRRLDKTIKLSERIRLKIGGVSKKMTWLVLTESWCGDAAQTVPIINKLAVVNPMITIKIILRDEHPELMGNFLSHGSRSIPKLLAIDGVTNEVLWTWGSRPREATQMADEYKKKHGELTPEFKEELQVWYNRNKGKNTIDDLLGLLALE